MKIAKILFSNFETALFSLFLGLFSLGQLQRFQLPNNAAFYAHDLLITLFLIWQFGKHFKLRQLAEKIRLFFKKITKQFPLEIAWLLWLIGGMLIGTIAGRVEFRSWLYLLRLIAYVLFVITVWRSRQLNYSPRIGIMAAGTLICLWGLIQYLMLPDTRFLSLFGWDNHYYRLVSTLFDPAFAGMLLVLVFGFWSSQKISRTVSLPINKVIQWFLVVTIAATFSRSSYLALVAFLGLQLLTKQIKLKFFLITGLIFLASVFILPKPGGEGVNLARTSTGEARLSNSQDWLGQLDRGQWLWGRGLFNVGSAQPTYAPNHAQVPDSLPVLIVNAAGLVGTVLTVAVAGKWSLRWWKQDPLWTSLFLAVLTHSLFNNTFLQPFVFLALWLGKKS